MAQSMQSAEPATRLTYEYLRNHPDDAARVLERLPVDAVSALVAAVPARLAAPVLGAMLPFAAGRCLAHLPPQEAGALIAQLRPARAAAMLRQLDDAQNEAIHEHVPSVHAARIRRLRSYPDDTVGAWVDSDVVALSGNDTVAEAQDHLRAQPDLDVHQLYIVDERRRLLGTATIGALLRGEASRKLASLSRPVTDSVSTRMSVSVARRHRGWSGIGALPVLEPSGEFVGELRLGSLQHAGTGTGTASQGAWLQLLDTLASGYFATAADVIRSLVSRSEPRDRSPDRDH